MSNGKRWTLSRDLNCNALGLEEGERIVVLSVAEHNADLESLAQELEERAGKVLERRDSLRLDDPQRPSYERVAEVNRSAAQLVRAQIEEGGARG